MSASNRDEVFREKVEDVADFHFGEKVASVFDNMVERSVPFYAEMQRMIWELASDFAVPGTNVYDLGCSTGTTMLENVLVPYKLMENREMLLRAGFRYCDVFFKWYNFCGIIAVK